MKRKEISELRTKNMKDLTKILGQKKLDLEKIKMKIVGGKEKNLKLGKNLSDEIAKILTLIREKEIIESLQPEVEKETKVEKKKGKEKVQE